MGFFNSMKDDLAAAAAKNFISDYIKNYGEVNSLKINSHEKKIIFSVSLKGETAPIDIQIDKYALSTTENKDYIVIDSVSASREWIENVFNDHFKGIKHEIPSKYAGLIKKFL